MEINRINNKFQIQENIDFALLNILERKLYITQRELSTRLGESLGCVNNNLKCILEKGYIKIENFKKTINIIGYVYLLTPKVVIEKSIFIY